MVVIPKCQQLAEFFRDPKTAKCYKRLMADLDWSAEDGVSYMLALNKDRRHSMNDMQQWRYSANCIGTGELHDRRSLDKNTEGWILLTEKQVVPAGPKQCDTIQALVDMVMSQIKRAARAELSAVGQRTGTIICNAIRTGAEGVSIENVKAYWAHATKALMVHQLLCAVLLLLGGLSYTRDIQ